MKLPVTTLAFAAALTANASPLQSTPQVAPREPVADYSGFKVYSISPSSRDEARSLQERFDAYPNQPVRDTLTVAIPPGEVDHFNSLGLDARLIDDDLGAQLRAELKAPTYNRMLHKRGELPDASWYETYHDYADHLQYWDDLVAAFPDNSEKFDIGKSYEGRTIWAFRLFGDQARGAEKPIILWHATVHAREWISTMVIEYLAYQLIEGYKSGDADVTSFLDYYDFYLVPFHNPDGFAYSQTTDRMWRKNRQARPELNTSCIGTDGNRNWKFEWDAQPPAGGSSNNPCIQTYRGNAPGDTPENQAMDGFSAFVRSKGPVRSFVDFHSFGELVLTPYGYTCDPLPQSLPRMLEVANGTVAAMEAITERASNYTYGPGCEILYFSTGNSRDHHHAVYGASHSWTMELPPRNNGGGGFVLPPEQILPTVKEQWAGQLWLLNDVRDD